MAEFLFTNNAATTLAAGIADSDLSLTVATGTGSLFPAPSAGQQFNATIIRASDNAYEIVKVTAKSTDTFTIVRAQESTTAKAFLTGDRIELRVTAAGLGNMVQDSDIGVTVGYPDIPQSGSEKTTSYTLVAGDAGKRITVGSGGSIEIPNSVMSADDVVSIWNNTSGNITITCTITTAYIAGTDSDKATVTLATRGLATILFNSGTVCVITGNVS